MAFDIIIGRDDNDKKKFGKDGTIFLGKQYVKMGATTSLSNEVFLDVNRTHVISIVGKRGSGKSYTLSVMAEEITRLPEEIKNNLAFLFFDTMGIFWTMKYPNRRQERLLGKWKLKPEALDINLLVPKGHYEELKERGIDADAKFSLRTSELSALDWLNVFNINVVDELGIFIEKIINEIGKDKEKYSILDIVNKMNKAEYEQKIKDAAINRFLTAESWGLFDEDGTEIKSLLKGGEVVIIDLSSYTTVSGAWSIKALVIGLVSRRLLTERISSRKFEEIENILQSQEFTRDKEEELPLIWILIDEAHEFLPRNKTTPATDSLVQILREGRQPGISLVLATQQPGEIHKDVLTQSDIVIAHRLTSKVDIEALNSMMQTYLVSDIQKYINELPKLKGVAIVLDDNSERIYPIKVHPKRSWHGGEAPTSIKVREEMELLESLNEIKDEDY